MPSHVTIIQGHPDAGWPHFCHALADAYADRATAGKHEVRRIEVPALGFPVLTSREEWENERRPTRSTTRSETSDGRTTF